jgi:hypothetical protein
MRELSLQTYMCIYQWYRSNEAEAKAPTVFFPLKPSLPPPWFSPDELAVELGEFALERNRQLRPWSRARTLLPIDGAWLKIFHQNWSGNIALHICK